VYAYTGSPRIYSAGEHFRIERYVRPYAVDPLDDGTSGTLFVFPFDHETVPAPVARQEIAAALDAIEPGTLLFLVNIGRLRTGASPDAAGPRSPCSSPPRRRRSSAS
jgi:hypothetical protein